MSGIDIESIINPSNRIVSMDIWIPSNRPELAREAQKSMLPYPSKIFDGSGYESFSKLINHCIVSSNNDIVIIANDKARAKAGHINKIISLLKNGYGLVGLYRFGFFGFNKELIRRIGFMDERFVGGNYEDDDFFIRLMEADIAYYESEEIPYIQMPSSWVEDAIYSRPYFKKKWNITWDTIERKIPEEKYNYDIGPSNSAISYLNFSKSRIIRRIYSSFSTKKVI